MGQDNAENQRGKENRADRRRDKTLGPKEKQQKSGPDEVELFLYAQRPEMKKRDIAGVRVEVSPRRPD